jgi:hypothetical protein
MEFAAGDRLSSLTAKHAPEGAPLCRSKDCREVAEFKVLWPGQETVLCLFCTHRAVLTAKAMGFSVPVTDLEWVDTLKKLADVTSRLGGHLEPS